MCQSLQRALVGAQLLLLSASAALRQDPNGVVEGQVTDQSGAVLPRTHVLVKDAVTGFKADQVTSEAGNIRVSYLPIGITKWR